MFNIEASKEDKDIVTEKLSKYLDKPNFKYESFEEYCAKLCIDSSDLELYNVFKAAREQADE